MDVGGGMEEEDRLVDVEVVVDVEDSLDRAGLTSISSLIVRLRLRDTTGGVGFVFIDFRAGAAALRLNVVDVRFRAVSAEDDDRVCRIGGDRVISSLFG